MNKGPALVFPSIHSEHEFLCLRTRLREAEETLDAIRYGRVDALVVSQHDTDEIVTLQGAEHVYRMMVEAMNEGVITLAPDGTILYCNLCFAEMLKLPLERVPGLRLQSFLAPQHCAIVERMLHGDELHKTEIVLRDARNDNLTILLSPKLLQTKGCAPIIYMVAMDLTAQKRTESALREAEEKYRTIFENAVEGIFQIDLNGRYLNINPAMVRIFRHTQSETLLSHLNDAAHPLFVNPLRRKEFLPALRERGEITNYESQIYGLHHEQLWINETIRAVLDKDGQVRFYEGSAEDISERKHYETKLMYQANYDALTGLANRSLLLDRLQHAIAAAERYRHQVTVIFIDLDQFKFINDSLGHHTGDNLLKIIAARLKACVRENDTVARHGGDEFVIAIDHSTDAVIASLIPKILTSISQAVTVDGNELLVTASIGVSVYPFDGNNADTLLKNADAAMYRAKELGRNNGQFYTEELNQKIHKRMNLESILRHALERGEFFLHYQPQIALHSNDIVGAEALIRWMHSSEGVIPPAEFIPLAEELGLIIPIGDWVLRTACTQMKAWHDAGLPKINIAVNLSARQFRQPNLVEVIAQALRDSGLEPGYLELEITESMMMDNVEQAALTLGKLKATGIKLSIDDFGTGYSSLSYLKRLPIDVLKIDRTFVSDITGDADGAPIVRSIITLAHSLKLKVIAEGVENGEQLAYLRAHRCDVMQGYYFSKPLSVVDFTKLAQQRSAKRLLLQART